MPGWEITHDPGACECGSPLPTPRTIFRKNCQECIRKGTPTRRRKEQERRNAQVMSNPEIYLRKRLTCRLGELCRKIGTAKKHSILKYLGCTPMEFKAHIESQFTDGMTWENRGVFGWHVDHYIPCAAFDMRIEEHRHVCFHYTNLRPLWQMDNALKADKILDDIPKHLLDRAKSVGVTIIMSPS
jgi:hypothetical protein